MTQTNEVTPEFQATVAEMVAEEIAENAAAAAPAPEAAPVEAAPTTPPNVKVKKKGKKKLAAAAAPSESTETPPSVSSLAQLIVAPEVPASVEEPAPAPEPEVVYEPYKLFDIVPDGGPGSDTKAAIPVAVSEENIPSLLNEVARMILAVTGPRDGLQSDVNPKSFHAGVRVYRPQAKFKGKVTVMDEVMYAARVGHRILNAVNKATGALNEGKKFALDGGYGKFTDSQVRALAVWEATKALAAARNVELHLPQFVPAPEAAAQ